MPSRFQGRGRTVAGEIIPRTYRKSAAKNIREKWKLVL